MSRKTLAQSLDTTAKTYIQTGKIAELDSIPYTEIAISLIDSWEQQPRRYFSPSALQQMALSIAREGLKHPLLVRPVGERFQIIAGERRYQGAKRAGCQTVPCLVRQLDDREALEEALSENLLREDLNPIEVLNCLLQLLSEKLEVAEEDVCKLLYEMKNEWEKLDKSREEPFREIDFPKPESVQQKLVHETFSRYGYHWYSYTCSQLKLRKLPDDLYRAIGEGRIEYSKGLKLKSIGDEELRRELLKRAIAEKWSQKEIAERVREAKLSSHILESSMTATPQQRVTNFSQRLRSKKYWKSHPDLWKQLEKKLINLEKWLDEQEEKLE